MAVIAYARGHSLVEGPSREIAASRRLKQKTPPTHGSFSAMNKVQVVEVPSPERVARNMTWIVGLSLSRARAPKLPKQATDHSYVKVSGAPITRQPESPFLCTNTDDAERSSRPKSAVVPKNITKVYKIVLGDRKLKLHEIADTLKISEGSVFTNLHEPLGMRKLYSKWVPCLLTPEQKEQHIENSERCLELLSEVRRIFCVSM